MEIVPNRTVILMPSIYATNSPSPFREKYNFFYSPCPVFCYPFYIGCHNFLQTPPLPLRPTAFNVVIRFIL